jgi:hypothetical protein
MSAPLPLTFTTRARRFTSRVPHNEPTTSSRICSRPGPRRHRRCA